MKDELQQYAVEPEALWMILQMQGGDGYDAMERVANRGWDPIPGWGRDGWDLGSWPYVIIFFRAREGRYEVLEYVEGDVTMYSCPTRELRQQITDELAFFHWKHQGREWVKDYESVEQLPDELRGPYRNK